MAMMLSAALLVSLMFGASELSAQTIPSSDRPGWTIPFTDIQAGGVQANATGTGTLVRVSARVKTSMATGQTVTMGSAVTASPSNTQPTVFNGPIAVELVDNSGNSFGSFVLAAGESMDVQFATTPAGEYVVMLQVIVGTVTVTIAGQPNVLTAGHPLWFFSPEASQTISFAALGDKVFGDADFTVSATASSGLMVGFTASGSCAVSGSTVHLTGVGSCTITASQAGDSNYDPATPVSQTFGICAGGIAAGSTSKAIPVLAAGSVRNLDYFTTIEVVNPGSKTVTLSGSFYKEDGSAFSVPMTTNISALPSFTGSFTGFPLGAKRTLVITATSMDGAVLGWGQVDSCAVVAVNTTVDVRDGATGGLLSSIGFAPGPTNMERFVVPRLSDAKASPAGSISAAAVAVNDTNLVVINTGDSSADLTGTLVSAAGAVMATNTITLGPHMQQGIIPSEFFGVSQELGSLDTYIWFESDSAQWAATAWSAEGLVLTSTVVDAVQ